MASSSAFSIAAIALRHHAARGGPGRGVKLGIDALVIADFLSDDFGGKPRDDGADAGRAEVLGVLAPADDAVRCGELDEMIVAPPGIAAERLDPGDFHENSPFAGFKPAR